MSRHRKLCRDRKIMSRQKNYVMTEKTVLRQKCWKKPKTAENGYFVLFSSPFHLRTINTHFFRFLGQQGGGRTPLMGFLSLNYPFFLVLLQIFILIDLRVDLEQIFIFIEEISLLYSDIQFI